MKKLAIITVDYNSHADTKEFLESAKKLKSNGLEVKYIILDNGSSEPLQVHDVDLIQTGDNLGFTGGYNRGLRYARQWGADYYLIINNDVLFPDSQILKKLVGVTQSDPRIGVVSPKILFAPGFEYHKERYTKQDEGKVIWYAGGSFDWSNIQTVHRGINEVDKGQFNEIADTQFPSGCCMLVTKEVLDTVGLFEEKFFAYFEDADYALRVKKAGFRQIYTGETAIWHKVSRSAGIGSHLTDYLTTRNQIFFGKRYSDTKTKFALFRQSLKLLLSGRRGQRQGVWDYFMNNFGRPSFLNTKSSGIYPLKMSIVVINYKTLDLTLAMLKSVFKKDSGYDPKTMEVILIDNASQDGISDVVAREYSQVKFIANSVNKGFSGGNNQGIDFSRGENILLLNSDIEVRPNALTELIQSAKKYPEAVLAGKLYFPDGTAQDSIFNLPTVTGAVQEYFLGRKGSYFMYLPESFKRVECAVMACFMIPWSVINRVGKLDEGTFMYFEDVEYCRRLKSENIPVYFVPTAEFTHHHGASSKKIGADKSYALLKKGSLYYHGKLNYGLLWGVLWIGQRIGFSQTPKSRWNS
jgi:GT2 family glycosyltransferase